MSSSKSRMFSRSFSFITIASVLIIISLFEGPPVVRAHGHSHDENPAYKYSKQANQKIVEDEILEEDIIDLPPQHGPDLKHDHGHGHSHGGHGHSHGGHGHSHGGHGHSHGGHGHSHGHGHAQRELTPEEREEARQKLHQNWDDDEEDHDVESYSAAMNAVGATVLISLFPFVLLHFVSLDKSKEKESWLKIALSFAAGGLLGDSFLHLIPHAIMAISPEDGHGHGHSHSHSHGHGHSHGSGEEHDPHDMRVGGGVLCGIVAFLAVEKLVRILKGGGHSHSHGLPEPKKETPKKDKKDKKEDEKKDDKKEDKKEKKKEEKKEEPVEKENDIKVAGILNLFADGFHNFTDGLAIGTSFMAGSTVGWTTTIFIMVHEIPHEIGDYAILIQSGIEPWKARLLQLCTAIPALIGCLFAILAQKSFEAAATVYILPFTAGGFIYIATVSVIPELLEGTSLWQSIKEIFFLLLGVGIMIIIAQYE